MKRLILSILICFAFISCKNNNLTESEPFGTLINSYGCKHSYSTALNNNQILYRSNEDCIEYEYDGENKLILKHINAGFNCCSTITADIDVREDTIIIKEREYGEMCCCLCLYDLDYAIVNIKPKKYKIKVLELCVNENDEKLEFYIDLSSSLSGKYCVKRDQYPWGI